MNPRQLRRAIARAAALTVVVSSVVAAARLGSVHYEAVNLVSDLPSVALHVDPELKNGWGLANGPLGISWVAAAHTAHINLYGPQGQVSPLHIHVPAAPGSTEDASPTGLVLNPAFGAFPIPHGNHFVPATVLVATEGGTLAGWSPFLFSPNAVTLVDSTPAAASYKGLALARVQGQPRLYATDFHNGRVDVFDHAFQPVVVAGAFVDPMLPANYVPFGIQAIDDHIFVTYAFRTNPDDGDETPGAGLGLVSEYDAAGTFVRRLASNGVLDAPWGVALAPAGFGPFSHAVLVGNFGDGRISGFDRLTGAPMGQLQDDAGSPIGVEGLWGIGFRNGLFGAASRLYFAAGPGDEDHGLFGFVRAVHD